MAFKVRLPCTRRARGAFLWPQVPGRGGLVPTGEVWWAALWDQHVWGWRKQDYSRGTVTQTALVSWGWDGHQEVFLVWWGVGPGP